MYPHIIALHSLIRWFVLLSLLYSLYRAYSGWRSGRSFTSHDNSTRQGTAAIAQVQLVIGVWLYFLSPIVDYFLHNFKDAVHMREIRFFGMEHSLMMFIAVIVISAGSVKAKSRKTDREKFKTMALWYSVALFIILTSIPWEFSPLVSRPSFRGW